MDSLTFTTKLVEATAWPLCVLVISLLFRSQISELLRRIVKGKIPGGEFEFSEGAKTQLATAEETAIRQIESFEDNYDPYSLDTAYELLDTLPRAAVIEGWRQLSRAATDQVVESFEGSSGSSSSPDEFQTKQIPPARLVEYLRQHNILTPDQLALLDELRRLRNQAVHNDMFDLNEKKAKEYLILAELLIDRLNSQTELR